MLKRMPGLNKFRHNKDLYRAKAIIGENDGNDEWPITVKIWRYPHERNWRYYYGCKGELLTPKNGVAYGPKEGAGENFESANAAHAALKEALEKDYA